MDMLSDMGGSWQDKKYKQDKNDFLKFSIVTGPNINSFQDCDTAGKIFN